MVDFIICIKNQDRLLTIKMDKFIYLFIYFLEQWG